MRSKSCDLVVDNSQERTHGEGLSKIAMELSTEELQDEVERLLRRCSFDHLREVGNLLGLVEDDFGGDKLSVRRAINDVFDAVDTADEKISLFSSIKSALPEPLQFKLSALLKPVSTDAPKVEGEKLKKVEEELLAAQIALERAEAAKLALVGGSKHESSHSSTVEGVKARSGKDLDFSVTHSSASSTSADSVAAEVVKCLGSGGVSAFRKEFKIVGTIGGLGDKRLDYISLCSQVAEGRARGFLDDEIVFGLKRAVAAGSELRMYLDSLPSLSYSEVMAIIRGSYREKSSSELFQELNLLTQKPNEDAQEFLLRAMALKQRVHKTAEGEGTSYDVILIHNAFSHALRTGIRDDAVRNHLKPFLDKGKMVPDTVLLEQVNSALSEENARAKKLTGEKKRVNFAGVSEVKVQESGLEQVVSPLMDAIHRLTKDMEEMKSNFKTLSNNGTGSGAGVGGKNRRKKTPICRNCEGTGVARCDHCFKCLNSGHKAEDCKLKN